MGRRGEPSASQRREQREDRMRQWLNSPAGQECKRKSDSLIDRFGPEIESVAQSCKKAFNEGAYSYTYDLRWGGVNPPVHCNEQQGNEIYTRLRAFEVKHGESMLPVLKVQDVHGEYKGVLNTYAEVEHDAERAKRCEKDVAKLVRSEKLQSRIADLKSKFGFGKDSAQSDGMSME